MATQTVKFRHSSMGMTRGPLDKMKQMMGASLWYYQKGSNTIDVRKEIVKEYLNGMPLGAASGYASGNAVGIMVERKIAFGFIVLRLITRNAGKAMADRLRKLGQRVTTFVGEGMVGSVTELYIVCRRRDLKWILPIVKEEDPKAFYIIEQARDVSKVLRPIYQPITGWRAIFKKK